MRLLQRNTDGAFILTKDLTGDDDIPLYAILSHTWGPDSDEVTYRDIVSGTGTDKAGYDKIRFCDDQARRHGLLYFWIDTCCIDKTNSAELNEAINSMFKWYRNSAKCYVYLTDVSATDTSPSSWESAFRASRWFTRGWTLQELLAPPSVQFFSKQRSLLGDRTSLQQQIYEITGIAKPALCREPLDGFSVEERFGWAEARRTKREEDWAYSLLGIFGVFIPAIYGEGKANAIRRLRAEIGGERQDRRKVFDVPMDVNKNYVQRPELESRLFDAIPPGNDSSARVALWGLGGSGKTQLALRFVMQHQRSYSLIFWLNGDSWAKLLSGFARMLRLAGVTSPIMSNEAEMASEWLQTNTGWLLVVDNLDDSTVLHRLHDEVLRTNMRGLILVTSRNDEVSAQWHTLEVSNMTNAESTELMGAIAGSEHTEGDATADLLKDLGHLPLAVDQAASYIRASGLTVAKYHELYRMAKSTYLEMYPSTRYNVVGRHNVMTTWNLSFNEVAETHPQAATLLLLISLLEADDIPLSILKSCVGGQYYWSPGGDFVGVPKGQGWIASGLKEVLGSESRLIDARRELQRFGFVKYQTKSESLYIHPLVQYWACQRLEKDSDPDLRRKLVVCLLGLVSSSFEKQDLLPALPYWPEQSSRTFSLEERKLDIWPWRKYPSLTLHAQQCILLATGDIVLRSWKLGDALTIAHISLPLLQVLEYSSFGSVSEDYKSSMALIDACLLACTQYWAEPDHDVRFSIWAASSWRHHKSGLCGCFLKSRRFMKERGDEGEQDATMTLLQKCRGHAGMRSSEPSAIDTLNDRCRVCSETFGLALQFSIIWPATPRTLNPFRSNIWIRQYWDTVDEYLDVRAIASKRQPYRSIFRPEWIQGNDETPNIWEVHRSFQALCGNLSEESRRASYFLALHLGDLNSESISKIDEIICVLEPYVTQSIASPEGSWSHERCIIEFATALIHADREIEARKCLQQVEVAYEKAGILVPAVCRGELLKKNMGVSAMDLSCSGLSQLASRSHTDTLQAAGSIAAKQKNHHICEDIAWGNQEYRHYAVRKR